MIYTIGHSNMQPARFIELLHMHGVTIVADVRSYPTSKYVPQFNADALLPVLQGVGIRYSQCGAGLGGKPYGRTFYHDDGRPNYAAMTQRPEFKTRIAWLLCLEKEYGETPAIMCSEENPIKCHRRLLVTPALVCEGIEVLHIRREGRAQSEAEFAPSRDQHGLFE